MWRNWWLRCHTQSPMSGFSHSSANQVSSSSESWELNKNNRNGIQYYCNLCKKFNGILIYRVASGISNIIDYKLTMSRIISLHHILFLEVTSWISEQLGNNPWNGISLVLLLSLVPTIQIPEELPGCLDGSSDWSVGGGWTTGVGGRTLLWEVGPWPGSSPPHSPPPPALQTELHTSNSHILALGFHESPILHPETFSLQLSPVLLHSITSGPKSSSPAYLPGTKGLFSEQQGVLFLLCSLLSLPPILSHSSVNSKVFSLCSPSNPSLPPYLSHSALSLPTFSLSREFFVLHCKLFLHLKLFFRSFRYFCFQILSPSWQAVENGIDNGIKESGDDWLGDDPEEYWWQLNLHLITYKHVDPLIFGPRTWL